MEWESYEAFVEQICRELAEARGITVFSKRTYRSTSGRDIEIDVSFEFEAMGARIFCLIECKHHRRRVEAVDVLTFAKTIELVRAHKGIIVSTAGFQRGAVIEADREGIALATLDGAGPDSFRYVVRAPHRLPRLVQGHAYLVPDPAAGDAGGVPFDSAVQLVRLLRRFTDPPGVGRL
jgi:hypothetical protein